MNKESVIGTGVYRNNNRQQWEAWTYNGKTKEREFIGCCSYIVGEIGRRYWEKGLWNAWLKS